MIADFLDIDLVDGMVSLVDRKVLVKAHGFTDLIGLIMVVGLLVEGSDLKFLKIDHSVFVNIFIA